MSQHIKYVKQNELETVSRADSDDSLLVHELSHTAKSYKQPRASNEDNLCYSSGSEDDIGEVSEDVSIEESIDGRDRQTREFIAWTRASSSTLQANNSFECEDIWTDTKSDAFADDLIDVDAQVEQSHRQKEMNWFAFHANADEDGSGLFDNVTHPESIFLEAGSAIFTDIRSLSNRGSTQVDQNEMESKKNRNLACALEYFADPDKTVDKKNQNIHKAPLIRPPPFNMAKRRKPITTTPYSECIMVPRPLFFGHSLAPSVIKEAKRLVALFRDSRSLQSQSSTTQEASILGESPRNNDYTRKYSSTEQESIPYLQLPAHYKNFQDSIEIFGFGCSDSIFTTRPDMDNNDVLEGNPYVKLFQPVWGDQARLEREDRIRSKQCVSRGEVSSLKETKVEKEAMSTLNHDGMIGTDSSHDAASTNMFVVDPRSEDDRPLNNFELTGGLVPLYACDDAALPIPSDIGLYDYEGSDDQVKHIMQSREQEFILKQTVPDVFGMLRSPPCFNMDDSGMMNSYLLPSVESYDYDQGPMLSSKTISTTFMGPQGPLPENSVQALQRLDDSDDVTKSLSEGNESQEMATMLLAEQFERSQHYIGPTAGELLRKNRSLSELHPATSMLKCMPLLSDRSPFTRYIEINTEGLVFSKVGEVEPFFCSLSLWNIDKDDLNGMASSKITESLHFDFIQDENLEKTWSAIPRPYAINDDPSQGDCLVKSRRGLFPLPTTLKFTNIYAVLLVRRARSKGDEIRRLYHIDDVFHSKGPRQNNQKWLREKALENVRTGNLLQTPFAFGVMHLGKVDVRRCPLHEALEMPLYHLDDSDLLERVQSLIIRGPVLSKLGVARMKIRNYDHLGTALHDPTLTSRPKVVDFSGELLAHQREHRVSTEDDCCRILFQTDSTAKSHNSNVDDVDRPVAPDQSPNYLVELVSLLPMEPWFHTTFMNELICQPMKMHNTTRALSFLKIEVVIIKWDSELNKNIAHRQPEQRFIHNPLRRPQLLNEVWSACGYGPYMTDEVKIKLPSALIDPDMGKVGLLISAYCYKASSDANTNSFFTSSRFRKHQKQKRYEGEGKGLVLDAEFIGCGFLPLSKPDSEVSCLLDNGIHQVPLQFDTKPLHPLSNKDTNQESNSVVLEYFDDSHSVSRGNIDDKYRDNRLNLSVDILIVAISSVFPQNITLSRLLHCSPSRPHILIKEECGIWPVSREDLVKSTKAEKISQLATSGAQNLQNENQLLNVMEDFMKLDECPFTEISKHLFRVLPCILRCMVSGTGDFSLVWCNPSSMLPLRVNAFASFLHFLVSIKKVFVGDSLISAHAFSEPKPDIGTTLLESIISLIFDEQSIFSGFNTRQSTLEDVSDIAKHFCGYVKRTNDDKSLSITAPTDHLSTNLLHPEGSANDPSNAAFPPFNLGNGHSSHTKDITLQQKPKVDTKFEFQAALKSSAIEDDGSVAFIREVGHQAFGGPASNRRRWAAIPSSLLATINEDGDRNEIDNNEQCVSDHAVFMETESLASTFLDDFSEPRIGKGVRQMRLPNTKSLDQGAIASVIVGKVPFDDLDIEKAGNSFLDSLGYTTSPHENSERAFGLAHHRKTRSRCSIDWTLPPTDTIIEDQQQLEHYHRVDHVDKMHILPDHEVSGGLQTNVANGNNGNGQLIPSTSTKFEQMGHIDEGNGLFDQGTSSPKRLPGFIDRLMSLRKGGSGRWWPYTYECLVCIWVFLLTEQSRSVTHVSEVISITRGLTVECAPVLFQLIKKSLGWRIDSIFRQQRNNFAVMMEFSVPLMSLDESFESTLEDLVRMVTDACIDSRNFDSPVLYTTAVRVNDSIIRFLRDLFSLLEPFVVQRLLIVYFSRFSTLEGKFWQDHESIIGLRTSSEVLRMQVNAITLLIRFSDFVSVNKTITPSWDSWPLKSPTSTTNLFFDGVLRQLNRMEDFEIVSVNGPSRNMKIKASSFQAHWLSNLILQACTSILNHTDDTIRIRGASVIYELLWRLSHYGRLNGNSTVVACMCIPLINEIMLLTPFLSSLSIKEQLRIKLLTSVIYVLQSAPIGIMRATWRKLLSQGFDTLSQSGIIYRTASPTRRIDRSIKKTSILGMFELLNLCLKTLEYETYDDPAEKNSFPDQFVLTRDTDTLSYSSYSSRKWHAHDAAVVVINTCRLIVRETLSMLRGIKQGNPASVKATQSCDDESLHFSLEESIVFTRGASSVYLTCLSLNESDIVHIKAIIASIEIVKVFGIEVFVSAVGQTMRQWLSVSLFLSGSRRKEVRMSATEFLMLLLRLSWDSFGSFSTIRIPLLSVIGEVIERKITTSTSSALREIKDCSQPGFLLPMECAEAAVSPLWISLDRLHRKSSSRNIGFKLAVEHLAASMKTVYRACLASIALLIVERSDLITFSDASFVQMNRINAASAGLSRQYLTSFILHNEVVEEAFLSASDQYSSTELPFHRIEWLLKLADFHRYRRLHAEEGFCRFQVYYTWTKVLMAYKNGVVFFPSEFRPGLEENNCNERKQSHLTENGFFEDIAGVTSTLAGTKSFASSDVDGNLFYGVCSPRQYEGAVLPLANQHIEQELTKEAERSADCFRSAMLIANSRVMMHRAVNYYARIHDYEALTTIYMKLASTVCDQIPIVDPSLPFELSSYYGRFYRVWFHGNSLPDDLMGAEFVYRTDNKIKLEDFGQGITQLMTSILPDKTPIDIFIDDGRPEELRINLKRRVAPSFGRDPIKIKVTPLRPCSDNDIGYCKGNALWFQKFVDRSLNSDVMLKLDDNDEFLATKVGNRHRKNSRSSLSSSSFFSHLDRKDSTVWHVQSDTEANHNHDARITGIRRFSFSQPLQKDRPKSNKHYTRTSGHHVGEKSLRVTELHVGEIFPCCVTRQKVCHRTVYTQSPLEAAVEDVCSWCSVLFDTIAAINGQTVTESYNIDQGIGKDAVKVVADCIYRSNVRDVAQIFLQKPSSISSEDDRSSSCESLCQTDFEAIQLKLARSVVLLLELLQLLIGRNRDLLLSLVKTQKRPDNPILNLSIPLGRLPSLGNDVIRSNSFDAISMASGMDTRTDSIIAIQRELQRSLVFLVKGTFPTISDILRDETPAWLRLCCNENYFSSKAYRRTNLLVLGTHVKFVDGSNCALRIPGDEDRPFSRPIPLPLFMYPAHSDEDSTASPQLGSS